MREILFRGKRVGSEEWVEGFYLTSPEFDNQEVAVITTDKPRNPYYVSKETIGQYTGLTDKNGTKIFEGDIVKLYLEVPYLPSQLKKISAVGVVEFNTEKSSYYVVSASGEEYALCFIDEVIGNIHDNPELLKESDNDE